MSKYKNIFRQIGIDEKSGTIYLCLIDYGRLTITEISKKTEIQRIEIYRKLPYLQELWIIVEVKIWKKKLYKAGSPNILEELLIKNQKVAQWAIWEIFEKYQNTEQKPDIIHKEWPNSISYVFSDLVNSLKKWDIFYRISSEINVEKSNSYLPSDYREKRDKKNLERYVITTQHTHSQKIPRLERETVIFPEEYEQFDENIQMIIYANKIAYIDYNTETTSIIENTKIANFQKKIFKALFNSIKK